MGVVVLLVAIVFMRVKLPEIEHQTEVDSQGHRVGFGRINYLFSD